MGVGEILLGLPLELMLDANYIIKNGHTYFTHAQ